MPTIYTPFGAIEALPDIEYFSDGSVRSCIACSACPLETNVGVVTPQYTANTLRKRQLPAILFYPDGGLRTLPLEEQTEIQTPLGPMPAEQITFYENGDVKRVFPLNGALSGFWSEEDEAQLVTPLTLDTPLGSMDLSLVSVYFGPHGSLRSLTLWPGAMIEVPSPIGSIPTRIGVSFYDNGVIRSLEPARPVTVPTGLGPLVAFDPDAVGIHADNNSLCFHQNGSLLGLKTVAHEFDLTLENGRVRRLSPPLRVNPCDGQQREPAPLSLEFKGGVVAISGPDRPRVVLAVSQVQAFRFFPPLPSLSTGCTMGAGNW